MNLLFPKSSLSFLVFGDIARARVMRRVGYLVMSLSLQSVELSSILRRQCANNAFFVVIITGLSMSQVARSFCNWVPDHERSPVLRRTPPGRGCRGRRPGRRPPDHREPTEYSAWWTSQRLYQRTQWSLGRSGPALYGPDSRRDTQKLRNTRRLGWESLGEYDVYGTATDLSLHKCCVLFSVSLAPVKVPSAPQVQ